MLMSYKVDDGVWQLCEQKFFFNLIDQNPSIETAAKIGLVVNSLNFKIYLSHFISLKVPDLNPRLVLQLKQIDEAEILP